MNCIQRLAFAALAALVWSSQAAAQTSIASDDFEGAAQPWKFRVFFYEDLGCQTVASGYPMYPESDQAPADATVGPPNGWYNVSWTETGNDNVIDGTSFVVADTDETVDTAGGTQNLCHTVKVFQEIASGGTDLGENQIATYTVTAKARANRYAANDASAEVGVFLQVLAAGTYAEIMNESRPITPDANVSEDFQVDLTGKGSVIVLAGFYAQVDTGKDGAVGIWDDWDVSWQPDQSANNAAEAAACNDTSVLRFEDPFGGAKVTCLTDTYEMPADAESWAGFGDTKRGDYYPFYFPKGGSITMDCATASGTTQVSFVLEEAPDPTGSNPNQPKLAVGPATCNDTESSQTINIPASDQPWGNLILYIGDKTQRAAGSPPVIAKNITVNGSREYVPPPIPTPTVPVWGLLALTGLVGFMGLRRRRK